MNESFDRLKVKRGAPVTSWFADALQKAIERTHTLSGPHTRRKITPWGTHTSVIASDGTGDSAVFRPAVKVKNGLAEVRWSGPRALIGGVAPTIGGKEIFTPLGDGQRPALYVSAKDFGPLGECGIYFRCTADPADDFRLVTVTPVAAPSLPPHEARVAHKLALFLRLRHNRITYVEDADRELFCSQGFLAILTREGGSFEPLFWAKFG